MGTIRKNRGVPVRLINKNVEKKSFSSMMKNRIQYTKFNDSKVVYFISTKLMNNKIRTKYTWRKRKVPFISRLYNHYMGEVDVADRYNRHAMSNHKYTNWSKKVGLFLFRSAVTNSFLLFKENNKTKMSFTDFKEELVKKITGWSKSKVSGKKNVLSLILPEKRTRCAPCYAEVKKITDDSDVARAVNVRTKYECLECGKNMCLRCFIKIHK